MSHFRDQFLDTVDVNAIVYELVRYKILSEDDVALITRTPGAKKQNILLYHSLIRSSSVSTLMTFCKVICDVHSYPKMRGLGEAMKTMLERGRCFVSSALSIIVRC